MSVTKKDIEMLEKFIDQIEETLKKKGVKYTRLQPTEAQKREMLELVEAHLNKVKNPSEGIDARKSEGKAFIEFLKEMSKLRQDVINSTPNLDKSESNSVEDEDQDQEEQCYCPACLTYSNFEEKLQGLGGKFDKTKFLIGGKIFHAKYHISDNGDEKVVIEKDDNLKVNEFETLQKALEKAVKDGDMQGAQAILDRIINIKN